MAQEEKIDQVGLLDENELSYFIAHASELEHPREMIIDVLRAIQKNHGWVPDEGVELTATILGLEPIDVEEVATFYDKIFRCPVGRFPIHICDSISCCSNGSEELAAPFKQQLGIEFGQTTADGLFTLLPSCCLGVCGRAPAVMIHQQLYGPLDSKAVEELINKLRREGST
jgi:NADH-quinone oxidoreductase subunit E